ncbi:hypothetical protein D9757_003429 [Collybiopsis confluens]|uniref:F-box domain-containing protein n=1 Tax=Collybiopsis confluens TaxID=2823264 RepID=A0A8H5HTH6_9AGAR|nr:hypothetical protein D9757_003429 [Collybiopsis confluens]
MPTTLRRRNRQELTLRKSFVEAMRDKLAFHRPHTRSISLLRPAADTRNAPSCDLHYITPPTFYSTPHSIRNLPVEVLLYVFILGSEEDPLLPLTVSHVCRFWHVLAVHAAPLWRRIVLGSHYTVWQESICRARACTLDIEFTSHEPLAFYEVQRYMHLVMPHIRRWRSLRIVFTNYYQPFLWNAALSECCTRSNHTQVPELEELCLVYRHNDDTKEFCLFSGRAPRLRRLVVDGIRLTWLPSLFQNLTHLDYTHHGLTNGCYAIQEISNLLRVSSRLKQLGILFPYKQHRARPPSLEDYCPSALYLPMLEQLHLRVETKSIPIELLVLASLLNTPGLVELKMIDVGCQRQPFPNVNKFWKQYSISPSVRVLYLQDGWNEKKTVVYVTGLGTLEWLVLGHGRSETVRWFCK